MCNACEVSLLPVSPLRVSKNTITQEMPLGSWNISVSRLVYPGNFITNFYAYLLRRTSKLTVLLSLYQSMVKSKVLFPYLVSLSDIKAIASIQRQATITAFATKFV